MTRSARHHRLGAAALAAAAGLTAATALAAGPAPQPTSPQVVPVVVQDTDALPALHVLGARLAPGARLELRRAAGPAQAQSEVARAAARSDVVLGAGTDVRAALEVARQDRPGLRVATVPAG